jgi:transposase
MTSENSSVPSRSRDDKKSIGVLNHDTAETLYAGTDHVARCPECGRETLWADREHLTHTRECPYYEVNRQ